MNEYSVCLTIGFNVKATSIKEVERKLKDMVFDNVIIHNTEIEKI